jgi:hypothetical protein
MTRFVVGDDRSQSTLFPERLDDYLTEDNPVRAIDVFVDELDRARLGFGGVEPEATGKAGLSSGELLKIYVYGYLNRVQSSRRLERECQRNIELVWLTGPPGAGLQDNSRLPQGQWRSHPPAAVDWTCAGLPGIVGFCRHDSSHGNSDETEL